MSEDENASSPPRPVAAPRRGRRAFASLRKMAARRKLSQYFVLAKTVFVIGAAIFPPLVATVIIVEAMFKTPILMSPVKVPEGFEKAGYSGETVSQRLLDEIANLNRISIAAKPKTEVGDADALDNLANAQLSTSGLDVKTIQTIIQTLFGKEIVRLSGEITTRRVGDAELARLRLRRSPGRELLIDVETGAGPEDLLAKGAMNLLENIDPEIAAGIYWREYGDVESATRLLAAAFAKRDPKISKYAYNLKSYILASQGRVEEALAASEKARSLGGDGFVADNSKVFALIAGKRHKDALDIAQANADRHPSEASAHNVLGMALQAMGRNDEAILAYRRALQINVRLGMAYRRLAAVQSTTGDRSAAVETLLEGLSVLPASPGILYDYAEELRRSGDIRGAATAMRKAYLVNPDNWAIIVSLAELEDKLGRRAEADRLGQIVRARMAGGETPPPRLKLRAEGLAQRAPAAAQPSTAAAPPADE